MAVATLIFGDQHADSGSEQSEDLAEEWIFPYAKGTVVYTEAQRCVHAGVVHSRVFNRSFDYHNISDFETFTIDLSELLILKK